MLKISDKAEFIINSLEEEGFQAYAVGGCVRDMLLGKEPFDWDIATSALPQTVIKVFDGYNVIPTGIRHGTVTVVLEHEPFEITTFRKEDIYTAHRRPESVSFVQELAEDLRRRDFTINAMAYNPRRGLFDFFNGREDLQAGLIKCVGEPQLRFEEDALRIMRALRFASAYGFKIEEQTGRALRSCAHYLEDISMERINSEFNKFLLGKGFYQLMQEWAEMVYSAVCMPPASEERLRAVCYAPQVLDIRLALLFENSETAGKVLKGLKYDNRTIHAVLPIVQRLKEQENEIPEVKKVLSILGKENYLKLLAARKAYEKAAGVDLDSGHTSSLMEGIIDRDECVSLRQLAVKGGDICGLAEGALIGQILKALLAEVIEEKLPNKKELLMQRAEQLAKKHEALRCDKSEV